jgi:hypothetical protein
MLPAPSTKLPPVLPVRRFRMQRPQCRDAGALSATAVKPASTPTRTARERAVVGNVNTAAIGAAGEIHT